MSIPDEVAPIMAGVFLFNSEFRILADRVGCGVVVGEGLAQLPSNPVSPLRCRVPILRDRRARRARTPA